MEFDSSGGGHISLADYLRAETPDPRTEAISGEFTGIVADCMGRIDSLHLDVLIRRNQLHHSYPEIARDLGINEGTVKSRLARAREILREQILKTAPDFGPDGAKMEDFFEPTSRRTASPVPIAIPA